jgi:hypothetical protein
MSTAYAVTAIASIEMLGPDGRAIKCQVLDGGEFFSDFAGSLTESPDGTVHAQLVDVAGAGKAFGLYYDSVSLEKLAAVKAAIAAALSAGTPFNVTASDFVHSINADCWPDFSAKWISYDKQRLNGVYLAGVTFRFRVES